MNIEKIFNNTFNAKCIFTEHALKRLQERFYSKITQLRLLVQASLRYCPKGYKNCNTISVSIMKEKADQEVKVLNKKYNPNYTHHRI